MIATSVTDLFASFAGLRIAGGCGECDAYQTIAPSGSGVWVLTVHHDDDCTTLNRRRAGGAGDEADEGDEVGA